jgi:simple sugar transport system ATP-binding protein
MEAVAHGIGMVHQHFMLSETESGLDNVLLAVESVRPGGVPRAVRPLRRAGALARLEILAREFGLEVDFLAPVHELGVGEQQRLEILKLLFLDADVLVLDEPTAVLTPQEASSLFGTLKGLAARGKTVIVITHKLREVTAHADAITVLRQGVTVASRPMVDSDGRRLTEVDLATLMVGRAVELSLRSAPRVSHGPSETLLRLSEVSLLAPAGRKGARPALSRVNLEVRAGEIVGVAGVEGNGQSDLLSLLASPSERRDACLRAARALTPGVQPCLSILGRDGFTLDARDLRRLAWGFVPEDRIHQALLPGESVEENYLLGRQHRPEFSRLRFLRRGALAAAARTGNEAFDVRPRDISVAAGSLSGGNQQKLVLARELALSPRLLVCAQPTRGVDVGAIESIHRKLLAARNAGMGILLVSSELDEILSLSDRIVVFQGGAVAGEFDGPTADEGRIGLAMGGRAPQASEASA